ncbi:MAG: integrase catalytic domain-containing protein [Planctomycetota bacterium]|jgi:transposase InsO family protein
MKKKQKTKTETAAKQPKPTSKQLLTNKQKNQLSKLYKNLDNPASYTSFTKLYKTLKDKYTKEQIIDFLKGENAYIYNKPTIRKFSRLKTYASAIDEIHQADIGFLQHLSDSNDGMSNLLFVIDVFSKYLWVRPLPNKKTLTVAKAYEDILKSSKRIPMRLHTDRGVEFFSRNMKQVLDKYKIKHYATFSGDTKASLAEVAIKTIKT